LPSETKAAGDFIPKTSKLSRNHSITTASLPFKPSGLGHTYLKLLCIAFDLAVLRAHLDDKFPRFVYHDGVFETLDPRKKANLLKVIREYADLGVQPVISLIDADKPPAGESGEPVFAPDEIVLTLHDEGNDGRLFRMASW
jgi:uncharacterized protein YydD (DUF2326 family)